MCVKQKYDMRNSFVLYPKDLQKSHDKVAYRIRMKADAKMRRDFKKAYRDIAGQMDLSKSFYTIEVRGREVIQVRGMKNVSPTPEVEKFMEQWKKKVLAAPAMQQAA